MMECFVSNILMVNNNIATFSVIEVFHKVVLFLVALTKVLNCESIKNNI